MTSKYSIDLYEINNGLFDKIDMLPDPVERFSASKQYGSEFDYQSNESSHYDSKNEPQFDERKHLGLV